MPSLRSSSSVIRIRKSRSICVVSQSKAVICGCDFNTARL